MLSLDLQPLNLPFPIRCHSPFTFVHQWLWIEEGASNLGDTETQAGTRKLSTGHQYVLVHMTVRENIWLRLPHGWIGFTQNGPLSEGQIMTERFKTVGRDWVNPHIYTKHPYTICHNM